MKQMMILCLSMMSLSAFAAGTEEVPLSVNHLFVVENGFDSNDNVEVIIAGFLPDTCHKLGHTSAVVDRSSKKISIEATAYVEKGRSCLQVRTPFLESIPVGLLEAGRYHVELSDGSALAAYMQVDQSYTPSQDNELYAPVKSLQLSYDKSKLLLKGDYPYVLDGCMRVREVKTYVSGQILVVLPIVEFVRDDSLCENKAEREFTIEVDIDPSLGFESLAYIRTASGRSQSLMIR